MSAITPFLEQRPTERGHANVLAAIKSSLAAVSLRADDLGFLGEAPKKMKLDADGKPLDPLAKSHTELSRLLWARTLVAKALVGAKFHLGSKGADLAVFVEVAGAQRGPDTGGVRRDVIPWHFNSREMPSFKLFSENSKMRCPTFDLPAGTAQLGGSCPGATWAQSSVPDTLLRTAGHDSGDYGRVLNAPADLLSEVATDWATLAQHPKKHEKLGDASPRHDTINLQTAVCQHCYATGGKYSEVGVQFAEVAKFAFVQALVQRDPKLLVELLFRAIKETLSWDEETTRRHKVRPIRVHSSGDFYNPSYADVWLQVAQRLAADPETQDIKLWAPTRTHVVKGFRLFWERARDAGRIPSNFIIRPSAYSVGDPAPYIHRPSPTGSKGTAVLFPDDARPRIVRDGKAEFGDGSKFDYQCGVYALDRGNKTCLSALAPDGKPGCRACWTQANLAVSYVLH